MSNELILSVELRMQLEIYIYLFVARKIDYDIRDLLRTLSWSSTFDIASRDSYRRVLVVLAFGNKLHQ